MSNTAKVKSGWATNREVFARHTLDVFEFTVAYRRQMFEVSENTLKGFRFNDDGSIRARLESMFTEIEFLANVGPCIDKALDDASRSDWWYECGKVDDEDCSQYATGIDDGEGDE